MKKVIFFFFLLLSICIVQNSNATNNVRPLKPLFKLPNKLNPAFTPWSFTVDIHSETHVAGTNCSVIVTGWIEIFNFNPFSPTETIVGSSHITVSLECGPYCRTTTVKYLELEGDGLFHAIEFEPTDSDEINAALANRDVQIDVLAAINGQIPE